MVTIETEIFAATVWLIFNDRELFSDKTISLLKEIDRKKSLSQAALAVPMSYKCAWDRIEKLGSSLKRSIVITTTGGSHGGGTELSVYGKQLLFLFSVLERNYKTFFSNSCKGDFSSEKFFRTLGLIYSKNAFSLSITIKEYEKEIA
jgi:molybdate transport repressor ModE-like protein